MIEIKRVSTLQEIAAIKSLQSLNLKTNLSMEEKMMEGFLTAEYSIEFLELMHQEEPSIIAKDGDQVVGYALVATKSVRHHHKLLESLFEVIDTKKISHQPLVEANYVVVGQLCVAKAYRGIGLSQKLYAFFQKELSDKYQFCITDVDEKNKRSLKAHQKAGFFVLDMLEYGGDKWNIVAWDWRRNLYKYND